ncbi:BTAD domain-containing putative transcriptional regulator [Actinokineospora sp. HUAS TT18]|uniref:AfsR/SARP family transcriptional regulator n=1 Tax=Actinokineospora sp. HUAS TT18 TaxID=3447451 RepID=UPI003F5214DD
MEFRILGALEVRVDGREVPLPAGKHRIVLAALLLRANHVVSLGELIEYLWAGSPPAGARSTVQTYVMRLRRAFAPHELITTHRDGYTLTVAAGCLDLHRFRAAVEDADRAEGAEAVALLRHALGLWRGPVLSDVPSEPLRAAAVLPLAEERLQILERVIDAELAAGRHAEVVAELRGLTAEHPLRERFWGQLMLALYRGGRQAEALAAYRTVHSRLRDELGIEPGDQLRDLHQAVLTGADARPDPAESTPPSWVAQCTLPLDVGAYAGRGELIEDLVDTLVGTRSAGRVPIAAVCGPPGVGKTALAVRVAHQVRAAFPDGQWYVRLGAADPGELLADLLHTAGVDRATLPDATEARAAQLRARLADRKVLLLLDDAADAGQIRPLLPGTPGCAVLTTSRVHLGGLAALNDARVVRLDVLRPDEAHGLFTDLIGARAAHGDALSEIARLCGYLPLALRLAAANLAGGGDGAIERYLAELRAGDRLSRLSVAGDPQAAVRATFDLSYTALADDARRLFRLLGLVPGQTFGVPVAAALLDVDAARARDLVDHLHARNLLGQRDAGRYQFHDLMRLYAAERAERDEPRPDRDAAAHRLFAHYLDAADGAGHVLYPDLSRLDRPRPRTTFASATQARDFLDAEHTNLFAAIGAAEPAGQLEFAWHLTDALRGYLYSRSTTTQWGAAARTALAAATHAGDVGAQAAMRMSLGILAWTLGAHPTALSEMEQALEGARAAGLSLIEGAALSNLGVVHLEMGHSRDAARLFTESVEHGRRTGQDFVMANGLLNLAGAYLELGELQQAQRSSEEALAICERITSPHAGATARSNLGQAHLAQGRLEEAEAHLLEALESFRRVGSTVDAAETMAHLAAVHRDAGRYELAARTVGEALETARTLDVARLLSETLVVAGTIGQLDGRHAAAVALFREAMDLLAADEQGRLMGEARIGLAVSYRHLDALPMAECYARSALESAETAGREIQRGSALTALAVVESLLGRAGAAAHAAEAVAIQERTGHRLGESRAREALSLIERSRLPSVTL